MRLFAIALSCGFVTACAHSGGSEDVAITPDYTPIVSDPATPTARLYADCFVQATQSGTYRRAHDGGGDELILFTCTGAPARAFYEALGPWSARIGSEFDMDGRTARSTSKIRRNLYGADYCSARDDADHQCVISFNAGDFLDYQR